MPPLIHIVPGPSAAGCVKQALHLEPGTLLVDHDALSSGPVPRWELLTEWRHVREQYLRSIYPDWPDFSFAACESDLLTNAETLRDADSIILWVGTGTAEQLLLTWMVQLLRAVNVVPSRLRVIQFGHEPTQGGEIVGIGILDPDQLRAHPPDAALRDEDLAEIDMAWSAVTATDPASLLAFGSSGRGALPFLRRGVNRLVFRFPDLKTGLNCWEHALLRYVRDKGPSVARVIGYTMVHDMKNPDWVGDAYLFARLRRLADSTLPHPFVSLTGSAHSLSGAEVRLTEAGARALQGTANFVELNGLDDWIGGVHLESSKGKLWYRRDDTLVAMSSR